MWDYKKQWMSGSITTGEKPKYSVTMMVKWAKEQLDIDLYNMKKPMQPRTPKLSGMLQTKRHRLS